LVKWNKLVPFLIWGVANPRLQPALHVYHGCGWVNPSGGNKGQRGKRPEKQRADDDPSNKGP
jgi:hypothetical protein